MKKRTKKQKQKLLLNILMVCVIVVCIAAGGLFTAFQKGRLKNGSLQNNSDNNTTYHSITITTIRGEVSILRNGISFYPEDGDTIMVNDFVRSLNQSTCEIRFDNSALYLDEKTELEFSNLNRGNMAVNVLAGGIVANINSNEEITLNAANKQITTTNGYFSLNANGEYSEEFSTSIGTEKENNDKSAKKPGKNNKDDLGDPENETKDKKPDKKTGNKKDHKNGNKNNRNKGSANNNPSQNKQEGVPGNGNSTGDDNNISNGDTDKNNNSKEEIPTPSPSPKNVCTISIYCSNILENMKDLTKGKEKYVPANGCILPKTQITFEEGETAFDILKKACEKNNVPLEYSWTPGVNSYYIEGINHLYEFDCGDTSGWLFNVNGQRPIRGSSYYVVNSGDDFFWYYTCSLGS